MQNIRFTPYYENKAYSRYEIFLGGMVVLKKITAVAERIRERGLGLW